MDVGEFELSLNVFLGVLEVLELLDDLRGLSHNLRGLTHNLFGHFQYDEHIYYHIDFLLQFQEDGLQLLINHNEEDR